MEESTPNNQPGDSPINFNSPSSPSHQPPHSNNNASSSSSQQHHINSPSTSSNVTLRIEPKKDPTALLTWICVADVRYARNYCYPRKDFYVRATRHLVSKGWKVEFQPPREDEKYGKFMFTSPEDENQRFYNLVDACNNEWRADQDVEDELGWDHDMEDGQLREGRDVEDYTKTLDEERKQRCGLCNTIAVAGIDSVIIGLNNTFCSNVCKDSFYALRSKLCVNVVVDDPSTTWSFIRYDPTKSKMNQECDYKLFKKAAKTFRSGFGLGIKSMAKPMIYNEEGEYGGFYTCVMQKDGICASVAVFRVHATKGFVEIPIVATRKSFRSQGLCKRLMQSIEDCVKGLGIHRLILPSLPTRLAMWKHLGFKPIQDAELNFLFQGNLDIIVNFDGTTLCHKTLTSSEYDDDL